MPGSVARPPVFLLADDEAAVRPLIARMLKAGFPGASVTAVSDPRRVLGLAAGLRPDAIFLDWVFPGGLTGPALSQRLKAHPLTRSVPVVLISGKRTTLRNRCQGVRDGADVFLAKPFTQEELCGLARALLERGARARLSPLLRAGSLVLNRSERTGWWRSKRLPPLTPRVFDLLWFLTHRSPAPVRPRDLLRFVWHDKVRDKHVTLAVARLRGMLRSLRGVRIETVPGVGYKLLA